MATRITETSRTAHSRLVRALARKYEEQGYTVKADHITHPNGKPSPVNGRIPDIAAYRNRSLVTIAEAETCDTISDDDTRAQWRAFGQSAHQFDVIVPQSCLQSAKLQASVWEITVDTWWWLNI